MSMTRIKKSKNIVIESLLKRIRRIDQTVQKNGIHETSLALVRDDLHVVCSYLGTSEVKAALFSVVLVTSVNDRAPHIHEISDKVGMEVIDFMPYISLLDELFRQGILRKKKTRNRSADESLRDRVFVVDEKVLNAIIREHPMPKLESETPQGSIEVFQQVNDWINQVSDNEITEVEFITDCEQLFVQNKLFVLNSHVSQNLLPLYKYLKLS